MKAICFLFLVLLPTLVVGQNVVERVTDALNRGDITALCGEFDKMVDVTLNNEQSTYSKSQAEVVLSDFFSKYTIRSFQVDHRGEAADDDSVYVIGTLNTKSKQSFRIYLYFKRKQQNSSIQEIRIEKL